MYTKRWALTAQVGTNLGGGHFSYKFPSDNRLISFQAKFYIFSLSTILTPVVNYSSDIEILILNFYKSNNLALWFVEVSSARRQHRGHNHI